MLERLLGANASISAAISRVATLLGERLHHQPCRRGLDIAGNTSWLNFDRWVEGSGSDEEQGQSRSALHGYYQAVIEPYFPRFIAALEFERAELDYLMVTSGQHAALRQLDRVAPWVEPSADNRAADAKNWSVTIVPSVFCENPLLVRDQIHGGSIFIYPISATARSIALGQSSNPRHSSVESLQNLLGRTRANILCGLHESYTTSQVAKRWNVSAPTASRHLSILREAGLVYSRRRGSEVHHILTSLGKMLTRSAVAASCRPQCCCL